MFSKTKIKSRTKHKTSSVLVETISAARKAPAWNKAAKLLSGPTKKFSSINLFEIDKQTKAGDTVVILGKVLSKGELTKKVRICALSISEKAKEKLKDSKSKIVSVLEEINKNPKADGIKVIK